MKVVEIVEKYLKENGFDGLYDPGVCACKIDDLMSCENDCSSCEPGYITYCNGGEESQCDGDCTYHIGPDKETT